MNLGRSPDLQLVSTSTTLLPAPLRAPSPWPSAIVGMVCLGLAIAWYAWASAGMTAGLDRLDAAALEQSSATFRIALAAQTRALEAHALALVDDARIRSTLATPGIDAATVEDVLSDLRKATGQSIYVVLDTNGVVRAVAGHPALRGVDLRASSLVKGVQEARTASEVWALDDVAMILAIAPVRLGDAVSAYFVVGNAIDAATLEGGVTTASALVSGDRVLLGKAGPDMVAAATLPAGEAHPVPGAHLVARSLALGTGAASAVAVWTVPRHHARAGMGGGTVLWPVLVIVGVASMAAAAGALRRVRSGT